MLLEVEERKNSSASNYLCFVSLTSTPTKTAGRYLANSKFWSGRNKKYAFRIGENDPVIVRDPQVVRNP